MRHSGYPRLWTKVLSSMVLAILAIWAYSYVRSNPEVLNAVMRVSLPSLAGLICLTLGIFLTNALMTKAVLSGYEKHLALREAFLLSAVTTAANYALPGRSGAGVRAVYLKKRLDFDFLDFATTLSGVLVLSIGVNGILGLLSVALLTVAGRGFDLWVAAAFGFAVLGAATIVVIPTSFAQRPAQGPKILARILNGWGRIRTTRGLTLRLVAIAFAQSMLMLVQTLVAFNAIGGPVAVIDSLFFTAAKGIALLATITPGALGVVEWLSVYMASHLSFSPEQAFAAQALMRTVTIGSALSMGSLAAVILGRTYGSRPWNTETC